LDAIASAPGDLPTTTPVNDANAAVGKIAAAPATAAKRASFLMGSPLSWIAPL